MTIRTLLIHGVLLAGQVFAVAQQPESSAPRTINLQQAVELTLKHNRVVRISSFKIEEDEHAKEVARSVFAHVTDFQAHHGTRGQVWTGTDERASGPRIRGLERTSDL